MKRVLVRLLVALKAALHLGLAQVFWYAVYRVGLHSGYFKTRTPIQKPRKVNQPVRSPFHLPDRMILLAMLQGQSSPSLVEEIVAEADEITAGSVRLFGGQPVPLVLHPPKAAWHWTAYEGRPDTWGVEDIKDIWEPARFGWVYPLGRAYLLTGDERYPAAFWEYFDTFLAANPPNRGPNWSSAQEVALRLMALLFAACVFQDSKTSDPGSLSRLAGAAAAHAERIPVTLCYARAQNNNHLITEALGMYAAGFALSWHPQARRWYKLGWYWLNRALQEQIQPNGVYVQHSMNYHRLMLQAALQANLMDRPFPKATLKRLAAATTWLLEQVDPRSGHAPNLGSNDGARILPLACGGYADYRPTAQAAARAFLESPVLPPGPWDELGHWLGQDLSKPPVSTPLPTSPAVLRLGSSSSWGNLRAAKYNSRPAHADQLHVDLWWRGENIALDAGTYRYTAALPWDNALAHTLVHNTIEVNNQNQMQRAGRFLWLDWAQAVPLDLHRFSAQAVAAEHNGYQHLGIIHRRILKQAGPGRWQVTDHLLPGQTMRLDVPRKPVYPFRLHWLLPDWPWELDKHTLVLFPPAGGSVKLALTPMLASHPTARVETLALVRAGQALIGPQNVSPVLGWYSPTYAHNIPALSFTLTVRSPAPFSLLSEWILEE